MKGGRCPYSWSLVGCCHQDLFNTARSILVLLPSSFFSRGLISVQVVHPYSSIDTTAAWKKPRFILSVRFDFHMIDSLSIAVHAFGRAKAGRPVRTYIQQLCEDTGCSPEDLPETMNDREKWRERVSNIRARGTT